jgi:hypothetical protein
MKTTTCVFLLVLLVHLASANATEESVKIEPFGTVTLYYNSEKPSHVVLFVSGDGGWNLGVVDMARSLAGLDALVVGIDITHYIKNMENAAGPFLRKRGERNALQKPLSGSCHGRREIRGPQNRTGSRAHRGNDSQRDRDAVS